MLSGLDQLGSSSYPHGAAVYTYGTAGFRTKAAVLDCAMFRVGLVAALRSKKMGGKCIGVMVTASHNPEEDNGVKIVDPMGDMLEQAWEAAVTDIANAPNDGLEAALSSFIKEKDIDMSVKPLLAIGYDTRPSSVRLSDAVKAGFDFLKSDVHDYGLLSTPQLHYMVRCTNDPTYGQPNEDNYYQKLATAFKKIVGNKRNGETIFLDAANGVGADKVKAFAKVANSTFNVKVVNDGDGKLNENCGADFVKVGQKPPSGMSPAPNDKCVVFDGDADRVVYFFIDDSNTFRLLDGDKIATLVAGYFKELITALPLSDIKLGLVQTAYANGSSTNFAANKMGLECACTPTGVKHIHHKAKDYDIGVYFEANGHGTVLFSDHLKESIKGLGELSGEQAVKLDELKNLIDVTNETVGDALSDCLLVESILCLKGFSLNDWNNCYHDLPNRQLKVQVADRRVVTTTDAERKCVTPAGLQDAIDKLVANYTDGRSFVRPSGTEDVVRVYAEASTREDADKLAEDVREAVKKFT